MIRFLITRGHGYTFKSVLKSPQAPAVGLMNYDQLMRARWLKRATYVFADLDRLSFWDLEIAAHLYLELKQLKLSVWNNPAKAKTRYALLRTLHAAGLNDFDIHRGDEIDGPVRFPVFVRKNQGHDAPLTGLLQTREELRRAIGQAVALGTPAENLVAIEFAAEPIRPGLYRKLSAFRIGNRIVPHLSVHDTVWLVKYGQQGIASEELYHDELALLRSNPFADHLQKVFELAGIEYGRADFGLYNGRIQVYEINTNPAVAWPTPHPSMVRVQSMNLCWETYLEALRGIDSPDGWLVKLPNGTLQRHRSWKNLFVRTRRLA
jgi:hypothetical protein